jgi:hypothetical protein
MRFTFVLSALFIVGCVHQQSDHPESKSGSSTIAATGETVQDGLGHALLTPARDLNLMRDPIPPALLSITQAYEIEGPVTCLSLTAEIATLDQALGPDVDLSNDEDSSDAKESGAAVGNFALDTLSDTTGGILPFRGLIRRASGAHEWEKRSREAYLTGLLRRAHLKGIMRELNCSVD